MGKKQSTKSSTHPVLVSVGVRGSPFSGQRGGGVRHHHPHPRPWPSGLPKAGWGGQMGPPSPQQVGQLTVWRAAQPRQVGTHPAASAPRGDRGPGVSYRGLQVCIRSPVPPACSCVRGTRNGHEATTCPGQTQHREEKTLLERSQTDLSLADRGVLCLQQGGPQAGLSPVRGQPRVGLSGAGPRPGTPAPAFCRPGRCCLVAKAVTLFCRAGRGEQL